MFKFSEYLVEEKASSENFGTLSKNEKGILHELLVGKHLLGGRHMNKHVDINGDSPREVHDRISKLLTPEQYENFSERSKKAAQDIMKERGLKPGDIKNVQWTSKPGDIKRSTGIDSSQAQDDSDIMITHNNGTHHGVSLKVSDDNKPITLSNNGAKSTFGGDKILTNHISNLKNDYPIIADVKKDPNLIKAARDRIVAKAAARGKNISPDEAKIDAGEVRKAWLESNPEAKKDIKNRTTSMLNSVAENMHNELQKLPPQKLSDHIRNTVLHAYKTPKEELDQGHTHMRHFTGGGENPALEAKSPGDDYEHFLSNPENLRVTRKGSSITYHHQDPETGKLIPFAMQTAKVISQSDPTSNLVMMGKDVERKQDIDDKKNLRKRYLAQKVAPAATIKQSAPVSTDQPTRAQVAALKHQQTHPIFGNGSGEHSGTSFYSPADVEHAQNMQNVGANPNA